MAQHRGLAVSLTFVLAVLAQSVAPAVAQKTSGRYAIVPLDGGIVRLDTQTGALTECRRLNEALNCALADDDRVALQEQVDRLSRENAELREKLQTGGTQNKTDTSRNQSGFPSDAEV